jgi:hypothetical protein
VGSYKPRYTVVKILPPEKIFHDTYASDLREDQNTLQIELEVAN